MTTKLHHLDRYYATLTDTSPLCSGSDKNKLKTSMKAHHFIPASDSGTIWIPWCTAATPPCPVPLTRQNRPLRCVNPLVYCCYTSCPVPLTRQRENRSLWWVNPLVYSYYTSCPVPLTRQNRPLRCVNPLVYSCYTSLSCPSHQTE